MFMPGKKGYKMKTEKRITLLMTLALLLLAPFVCAGEQNAAYFPDILGYKTLKCDLHMHTVFSDGNVWPTVRVDEAAREGLDLIVITDHIEYQPHRRDVPTNHHRPFEIAAPRAEKRNILLPLGAEITRDTPPGHFNALFLYDINLLDEPNFVDAIMAANDQGAFVTWNHPGWKGPELTRWFNVHHLIYNKKWLHGVEVCNGGSYYPEAHLWCLDKNLTMVGVSDIHEPSLLRRTTPESHRTMTLVFAQDRTLPAVREALFAGRTLVWYRNQLIGRKNYLDAMFRASVSVHLTNQISADTVRLSILNNAAVNIELERTGTQGPEKLTLPAQAAAFINIKIDQNQKHINLPYTALNFLFAPDEPLPVNLITPLPKTIKDPLSTDNRNINFFAGNRVHN